MSQPLRSPWVWLALCGAGAVVVAGLVIGGCTPESDGPRSDTAAGALRSPTDRRDTSAGALDDAVTPEAQPPSDVFGRVVDERGRPVAGARVWLEDHAARPSEVCEVCDTYVGACFDKNTVTRFVSQLVAHRHEALAEQLTDEAGAFRFEAVRQTVHLAASHGTRFADGDEAEAEPLEDGGAQYLLVLREPGRVELLVTREDETPFPGAQVQLHHVALGTTSTGKTDGAGKFAATLPPGALYAWVEAPGYRSALVSGRADEPPTTTDSPAMVAVLSRERQLVVTTRSAGRPIDAVVHVGPAASDDHDRGRSHRLTTRTSAGQATFDHLWTDSVLVEARAGELVAEPTTLYLDEEQETLTLELRASASLSVTVVDAQGDASDTHVQLTLSSGSSTFDRMGPMHQRFEFGPLPEGEYELFAHAQSMRPLNRRVDLKPGPNQLEVTLLRQLELAGVVVSGAGTRLQDVRVQLSEQTLTQGGWNSTATDEQGAFTLEVPEAGRFTVSLWHPEHGKAQAQLVASAPPTTITLTPGAALEVTVRDDDGRPVTEAQVRCEAAELGFSARTTDAEGRARFLGVGGQDVELWVSAEDMTEANVRVVVGPSGTTTQAVVLQREALLKGTFVDSAGRPAEGYTVCDGVPCVETTPADGKPGSFAVRLPRGKTVKLAASHLEGGAPGPEVSARAPAEGLRLLVPTPRQMRGRVLAQDGATLKRFEVSGHTFTAADGRFTVPAVLPELEISAEGYELKTVKVPDKGDNLGTISLAPLAVLRGVVLGERGPVAGATVTSVSMEGPAVQSRADGSFELRLLDSEPAVITATRGAQSAQVTAAAGKDVVLRLAPGTLVHGLVLGPDGRPQAADVTVLPQGDIGLTQTASAGPDGRFQVELPAGRFGFATRSTGAALVRDISGPRVDLVLSVGPDRCTFVLSAPVSLDAAVVVPGAVTEPAEALLQRPPADAALLARSFDGRSFRGAGLPCGPQTLVWCAFGQCQLLPVNPGRQPEVRVTPTPPAPESGSPADR